MAPHTSSDYNFKMLPGSGPYIISESDVVRRARASPCGGGTTTGPKRIAAMSASTTSTRFAAIVVRDQTLAFEMFKKGDLDFYYVERLPRMGRGTQLRPRAARPHSEGQGLQRQPDRHLRHRVQHAQGAVRRHAGPAGSGGVLEQRSADREAVLQGIHAAELVLFRRHLREPEQSEESLRSERSVSNCWPMPAGTRETARDV